MTTLSREPTSSLSTMTSMLQFVKYTLFSLVSIVAFLFFLATRISTRDETFVLETGNQSSRKAKSLLVNLVNNASNSSFSFGLKERNFVRFDELERGKEINPEEVQRTIERIHETCEKYNETETLRRKHFLYSPEHGALYCWIRKVGSTSFTKLFAELRGRRILRNYYKEIPFLALKNLKDLQRIIKDRSVFKFLVIRHPFERLVSSYRDRIEDNTRYTDQAWIYVPQIFNLTRPELFYSKKTNGNFLQQIFTERRRLKLVPTFAEFVTWLLKQPPANDDEHWFQYHKHCSLCTVNFDYILKLDNYTLSEVKYIFSKLGLYINRIDLPKLQSSRGGTTDFQRTCDYFASLSRDNALRLYERYKIDFEMFDCKYEDYVNCADVGK